MISCNYLDGGILLILFNIWFKISFNLMPRPRNINYDHKKMNWVTLTFIKISVKVSIMKTNKVLDVKTQIKQIQVQFGNSSDVKVRYFKGRDSDVYGGLIYLEGIVDTSTIEEYIVDPLVNKHINGNASEREFIITIMEEIIESASVEVIDTSKSISKIVEGWTVILFGKTEQMIAADTAKW